MITVLNGLFGRTPTISPPIDVVRQFSASSQASGNSWLVVFLLILTLIILVAAAISFAAFRFRQSGFRQASALFSHAVKEKMVTADSLNRLPQVVQRWLLHAGVIEKNTPNKLIIHQQGTLRTTPESRWLPFKATQYFTIDPPGFVWMATIRAAALMRIGGQDIFRDGHGNMIIKPLYLFNAADGKGKEIDESTIVRYLAEMAWFPQAAVSPYLRWQSINDKQAHVTMRYGDVSASGVYFFNSDGDVEGFEAKRYGDFGGIYRKEKWSVKTTSFADVDGVRIGNKSEVTWKLPEGDFHWMNMEVTRITPAS